MRYRKLDDAGDYCFGRGQFDFLINSPESVGQAVQTRLQLWTGEWFANTEDGTGWGSRVLGRGTASIYEMELRRRILETSGVTEIADLTASYNAQTRTLDVIATINTVYGQASIEGSFL